MFVPQLSMWYFYVYALVTLQVVHAWHCRLTKLLENCVQNIQSPTKSSCSSYGASH